MQEYLIDFDQELTPEQRMLLRATPACQRYIFERARVGKLAERSVAAGAGLSGPALKKQMQHLEPYEAALREELTALRAGSDGLARAGKGR